MPDEIAKAEAPDLKELLPPMPDKLERKYIGTRVGFTLVTVIVYFGTMAAIAWALKNNIALDQVQIWEVCKWVIGALIAAISGDTIRPSGNKKAAFGVTASGSTGQ